MIKFEDDCVGCPQGCINCGRRRVPYFYCDICGYSFEPDELADYNGIMVCNDCLFDEFPHYTYEDARGNYDN